MHIDSWNGWPLTKKEQLIKEFAALYYSSFTYDQLGEEFETIMEKYLNGS